jgi:hypothetical protein
MLRMRQSQKGDKGGLQRKNKRNRKRVGWLSLTTLFRKIVYHTSDIFLANDSTNSHLGSLPTLAILGQGFYPYVPYAYSIRTIWNHMEYIYSAQ